MTRSLVGKAVLSDLDASFLLQITNLTTKKIDFLGLYVDIENNTKMSVAVNLKNGPFS